MGEYHFCTNHLYKSPELSQIKKMICEKTLLEISCFEKGVCTNQKCTNQTYRMLYKSKCTNQICTNQKTWNCTNKNCTNQKNMYKSNLYKSNLYKSISTILLLCSSWREISLFFINDVKLEYFFMTWNFIVFLMPSQNTISSFSFLMSWHSYSSRT